MKTAIISDSTCLIGLEWIQMLEVLPVLFDPIVIPPEVSREFGVLLPWLMVEAPLNQAFLASLKLMVDDGEAEAIALAYEKKWKIILDDLQARKVATRLGISMIGTVGILVQAKQQDIISAIKPILMRLYGNIFAQFQVVLRRQNLGVNPISIPFCPS